MAWGTKPQATLNNLLELFHSLPEVAKGKGDFILFYFILVHT